MPRSGELDTNQGGISVESLLPLHETTFYAILGISLQPQHATGLVRTISELSAGFVDVAPSNLTVSLHRLSRIGLIRRIGASEGERINAPKPYEITELGLEVLEADHLRTQRLLQAIDSTRDQG